MILNGAVADGLDMRLGDDDKKNAVCSSIESITNLALNVH